MGKPRLEGKVIVVTGGTRGIGKGIARMCAAEGASVAISGRNEQDGSQVVSQIAEEFGTKALFIQKDISNEAACRELIEETVSYFGRIDGLVNNAGIFPRSTILETTEELFDSIFAVNVKGAFFCSKYAISAMQKTGGGSIVQIGSTNGFRGSHDLVAYACSKGALRTLNRNIGVHYARDGIRSNWVTVGWVASEGEVELHAKLGHSVDQLNEWAAARVPSGRMQTTEDMAYGVVYLLSDESNQVTGTELSIAGGLGI
ncbi:SDR family NAD(P)-dependent oxidoreductase [Paenibacillus sp. BC26]|uniref:SDR family NAD(P)-dependent oxidoreductase n=1 Tax=Paenibacillus sp. BC26 TaxID=1881032 RepID=UPI0008E46405|nr:oxidoreductase [Paenibacillus sp. BC26]SFS65479.1 NAD(P)-dependent dehydrogenase, short-chain alcohol dehydrogenase family [Paenibacillus sp. BC26]